MLCRCDSMAILLSLAIFAMNTRAAQNDVLRINTRLVEVDVVVRAKDGPVTNLAKDDFTIFDNGKLQPSRCFPFPPRNVQNRKRTCLRYRPESSRTGGKGKVRSATVILFDRLNTADQYQRDGRLQLLSYLKSAGERISPRFMFSATT